MIETSEQQNGFTLIETVLYIALFVLIMASIVLATYNMIASTDKSQYRSLIHNEGQFVVRKFNVMLDNASSVAVSGSTLTIHYSNGSPDGTIDLNGGKIRVNGEILNGDIAPVISLNFVATPSTAGARPVEIQMAFEVKNIYYDETFTAKKLVR